MVVFLMPDAELYLLDEGSTNGVDRFRVGVRKIGTDLSTDQIAGIIDSGSISCLYPNERSRTYRVSSPTDSSSSKIRYIAEGLDLLKCTFSVRGSISQFKRWSNMQTIILRDDRDNDTFQITVKRSVLLILTQPDRDQSNSLTVYSAGRVLSFVVAKINNNRFTVQYSHDYPNDYIYAVVTGFTNHVNRRDSEFPARLTGQTGTLTFTGNFGSNTLSRISIRRKPYEVQGYVYVKAITVPAIIIAPIPPPIIVPPPPLPIVPELNRITILDVRYVVLTQDFEALVEFVPDGLSDTITKIETESSIGLTQSGVEKIQYNARSAEDYYRFNIPDNSQRYVRVKVTFDDDSSIVTDFFLIERSGTMVEIVTLGSITALLERVNIFVDDISNTSITLFVEDDLLLSTRIQSVRVTLVGQPSVESAIIPNNADSSRLKISVTGLLPNKEYFVRVAFTSLGITTVIPIDSITTLSNPTPNPTDAQNREYMVNKLLAENLPNKQAKELMIMPFENKLELVNNMVSMQTVISGMGHGADRNPNNWSVGYKQGRNKTSFGTSENTITKSLLNLEILLIPEPHEDTDLIKDFEVS